jgi:lipopolysaccharide export system protein LptA
MKTTHLFILITALFLTGNVNALESDRDQPATIDADSVEIDFSSGKRIYDGNVKLRQGTIKLDADRLEVYFKNDQLEKAIAQGNPAKFRQRPDGKTTDTVGQAVYIHIDEVNNIITLTNKAQVNQGTFAVNGKTIVYNMATDKMKVIGDNKSPTRTTKSAEKTATTSESGTTTSAAAATVTKSSGDNERRPKITLKPKNAE